MSKQPDGETFECDECAYSSQHWHPVCPKCRKGRMYVQVSETRKLNKEPKDPYPEILNED